MTFLLEFHDLSGRWNCLCLHRGSFTPKSPHYWQSISLFRKRVVTRRKSYCEFHSGRTWHCFDIDRHIRLLSTASNLCNHRDDTFLLSNLSCRIPWPFRSMEPSLSAFLTFDWSLSSTVTTPRKSYCEFHSERFKHCFDIVWHIRFLFTASNRCNYRADTFLFSNLSCKLLIVVPHNTPTPSVTMFRCESWEIWSYIMINRCKSGCRCVEWCPEYLINYPHIWWNM